MTIPEIKSKLGAACADLIAAEANGDDATPDMRERVVNAAGQLYDALLPSAATFVQRLLDAPEEWEETVKRLERK